MRRTGEADRHAEAAPAVSQVSASRSSRCAPAERQLTTESGRVAGQRWPRPRTTPSMICGRASARRSGWTGRRARQNTAATPWSTLARGVGTTAGQLPFRRATEGMPLGESVGGGPHGFRPARVRGDQSVVADSALSSRSPGVTVHSSCSSCTSQVTVSPGPTWPSSSRLDSRLSSSVWMARRNGLAPNSG